MATTTNRDRRLWPDDATPRPAGDTSDLADLVRLTQVQDYRAWATPRYVRRLVAERRVPSYRVGRYRMVRLSDLDDLARRGYRAGGVA